MGVKSRKGLKIKDFRGKKQFPKKKRFAQMFSKKERICKKGMEKGVILVLGEKEYELGDELTIETDGRELTVTGERYKISREYESVMEMLYVIMWLMKSVKRTRVVFRTGERDFERTKEYRKPGRIRL